MQTEKRLIDANVLLNSFDVAWMVEYDETGCGMRKKAIPTKTIEAAPTIDAVPVVRCRECEHFVKYDDDYRDEYCCDGYCAKIAYIMDGYYRGAENRNADDFCSHGEKMGGGAEL